MKIGIFGGSFNPPHLGHKKMIADLILQHFLDRVIIVPVGNYYNKNEMVDFKDRYKMIKLLFKDMPQVEISKIENTESSNYTYQTMDYFKNKFPLDDVYFVLSTDNVTDIKNWKNADYLIKFHKFVVVDRYGDLFKCVDKSFLKNKNFIFTDVVGQNFSSTLIRSMLKNDANYNNLKDSMQKNVLDYISKNNLYKSNKIDNWLFCYILI